MTGGLDERSVVALHPLHLGEEEDGFCEVGRADTGTFVALPPEGVALLQWLGTGMSLGEATRRFEERFGTAPDLEDFLAGIEECGFVRSIGGPELLAEGASELPAAPASGQEEVRPRQRGMVLLGRLDPSRVGWLLGRPMRLAYLAVWLAAPAMLLVRADLRPRPADAFLYRDVLVNAVVVAAMAWTLVFLHELAHAIAVRALGCTARLSISRRLWFLVAQTEMTAVRTLPRERRYAPYLAGMTWDLAVMAGCLGLELAGAGGQLARTIVYTLTLSLVFQLSVFMRTDVYYVLANRLRLGNLMEDTRHLLSNVVRRAFGRSPSHDMADVPARELAVIRWYLPYYVIGSAAVTAGFALLTIPALAHMVAGAFSGMAAGPLSLRFWSSTAFVVIAGFQFGMLAFLMIRERRGRRATAPGGGRAEAAALTAP